MLCNHYW